MLQKSENRQVTRFTIPISPIDYCVRIKWCARPFIQWWYSVIYFLIVTVSSSNLLHSWLFIDPSENHYPTQTSKFNNFKKNRSSTMSNNVFKTSWFWVFHSTFSAGISLDFSMNSKTDRLGSEKKLQCEWNQEIFHDQDDRSIYNKDPTKIQLRNNWHL